MTEVVANTVSGFILSWGLFVFVLVPLYDIDTTPVENVSITMAHTVVSLIRSYFWRRIMTKVRPVGEAP